MVIETFRKQVNKNKDAIAIVCEDISLTYYELELKSNWLANELSKNHIKDNDIIAIVMNRSVSYIISILAVMKVGGTFIPIDDSFPDSKIQMIIDQSNCKNIITNNKDRMQQICKGNVMQFDSFEDLQEFKCSENYRNSYIIFTSGTTGNPKGVVISRKSFSSFLKSMNDIFSSDSYEKVAFLTSISFDIHLVEAILPLINGNTVLLPNTEGYVDVSKFLYRNKVDLLQVTPSRLKLLIEDKDNSIWLKNLKYLLVGGESFSLSLLEKIKKYTEAKIFNMYGPTEATIWVSCADLTYTSNITIGKPFSNAEMYVDDNTKELIIAGECLAEGYLNNEKLTDQLFKKLKINENKRCYYTGDIVQVNSNNEIQVMGRNDNQIKINGHRVELDEIEQMAMKFSDKIKDAVVYFKKMDYSYIFDLYIACQEPIQVEYIQRYLRNRVPHYMLPQNIFVIDEIPLNSNGKTDYFKINELYRQKKINSKKYEEILKVIERVTSIPIIKEIDVEKSISLESLSVDSINFVRVIIELEKYYNIEFDTKMMDLKMYENFHELINYIGLMVEEKKVIEIDESLNFDYLLDIRYKQLLGKGRYGIVYRANESEAMKLFHPIRDINSVNTEINKIKVLSDKTPFVARYIDDGSLKYNNQDIRYLKMQYIEGITVEELFKSRKVEPYVLMTILCSILETLKTSTNLGFGHHDINTKNIIISHNYDEIIQGNEYKVFLIDFGAQQDLNDCSGILDITNRLLKKLILETAESEEFVDFLNSTYIPILEKYEEDHFTDHKIVIDIIHKTLLNNIPQKWYITTNIKENIYSLPYANINSNSK